MKKIFLLFIISFFCETLSQAQTFKYWVMFKDKTGTPYSVSTPTAYLSPKSVTRRTKQGIAINQSDLPVTPSYVAQVDAVPTTTVLYRSKWLNGVVVKTTTASMATINSFSFVNSSTKVNKYKLDLPITKEVPNDPGLSAKMQQTFSGFNYGHGAWQAQMIGADCMHGMNFRGQGMTIAVLDIGFYSVDVMAAFDSLRNENRILGTRDFVNGDTLVYEDAVETHGTYVLSFMAANVPGKLIGTAPKASYWLLKTEDGYSETLSEEYNWIRGAEFADSVGADICTTSLGYNQFDGGLNDHVYATDLTGRKAPMSIAANMAARKGMFVLNAAGNEGCPGGPGSCWYYIAVPADADSICTVGAVDSLSTKAGFSSFGPTADGRIKPDLCARGSGSWYAHENGSFYPGNGTSFATPILAGAVACLWQYKQFATNMQILKSLKSTASRSLTPQDSTGWGVPNMCTAASSTVLSVFNYNSKTDDLAMLFPNPAHNDLSIRFTENQKGPVQISIIDVMGREVYSEKFSETPSMLNIKQVSKFSNGIYHVVITTSTNSFTKKFVKE